MLATGACSPHELAIALVYDGLVSVLWLLNGTLYMLRHHIVILLGLAVSTPVIGVVLHATRWGIYAAHWLGLASAILVEGAWVAMILRRRAASTSPEMRRARLPRSALLVRNSAPFAVYGVSYFTLLLADRGLAWSVGHHPFLIWFDVRYELGLDAALLAAAAGLAFLECAMLAVADSRSRARTGSPPSPAPPTTAGSRAFARASC